MGLHLEYSCRVAEDLAWAVGAPIDLPSRGAIAFLHTLQLAADKAGHTHLPWGVLLMHTQRLLSGTGPLPSSLPYDTSALAAHGSARYAGGHSMRLQCLCHSHLDALTPVARARHTQPQG